MTRIAPTPGRIVWFNGNRRFAGHTLDDHQPMAAAVAFVHPGETMVNLSVTDHKGHTHPVENVPLLQDDDDKPADRPWCCWMPYQIGQAKKHEAPPTPIGADGKPAPVVEGTGFAAVAGDVAKGMADQANGPGEKVEGDAGADMGNSEQQAADDATVEKTGRKRASKG